MFRSGGGGRACRAVVRSFVGGGALRRPGAVLWSSSSATCVPVGWVARARVPSRSLSASIAPVLCCLCRPFARGCLCVCPFPLPSAHSPTRYTLPPEAGCRGHHPACGRPRVCAPTRPAASPSRILSALHALAHSHTHTLGHRAVRAGAHTPHTCRESPGGCCGAARVLFYVVPGLCSGLAGPRHVAVFPPSHPVPLPARRADLRYRAPGSGEPAPRRLLHARGHGSCRPAIGDPIGQ